MKVLNRSILLFLPLLFFGVNVVHAQSLSDWNHDFSTVDGYSLGNLDGQGSWSNAALDVEVVSDGYTGYGVASDDNGSNVALKSGLYDMSAQSVVTYTFYGKTTGSTAGPEAGVTVRNDYAGRVCGASIYNVSSTETSLRILSDATYYPFSTDLLSTSTWYKVQVELDFDNDRCRVALPDFATTSDYYSFGTTTGTYSEMRLDLDADAGDYTYVDRVSFLSQSLYPQLDTFGTSTITELVTPQDGQLFVYDPTQDSLENGGYNVDFQYYYYNHSTSIYDQVCLDIQRSTGVVTTSCSTASTNDSGLILESKLFGLSVGERFLWQPYLKQASTSLESRGAFGSGAWSAFSITTGEDGSFLHGRSSTTDPFSRGTSTSLGFSGFGVDLATTSEAFCLDYENLCSKFPFAYMTDFISVFQSFKSNANSGISNLGYTYDDGFSSGTITFIDTSATTGAVSTINDAILTFRYWFDVGLWFLFGIWAFGLASKFV